VRNATYSFEGRCYRLEVTSPEGHHLHGLVRQRPWQVVEAKATLTGATVKSVFDASRLRDVLRQLPSCFSLSVTYTLSGNTIRMTAEAQNTGVQNLPMGFGLHPYFRLPLAPEARPYDCTVCVPAGRLWRLDHAKIPTGLVETVPPELDFRECHRMGDAELDHVFTAIGRDKGLATCRLVDHTAKAELRVRFGPEFPVVVVFAPAERPTVCFEPYTCTTNAVNLASQFANTGLVVLKPGAIWRGTVDFAVTELAG
jgi:aldose 1-epimerase